MTLNGSYCLYVIILIYYYFSDCWVSLKIFYGWDKEIPAFNNFLWTLCLKCLWFYSASVCLTLWDPMDCSTPVFPVLCHPLELAQAPVHESVMPSNHLVLCHPLLLLPSIFPSIRVSFNELTACIRWPKTDMLRYNSHTIKFTHLKYTLYRLLKVWHWNFQLLFIQLSICHFSSVGFYFMFLGLCC